MAAKYGGIVFQDRPYRNGGNSFYWEGQLSLVGLRNGKWETIQSIGYGFSVKGSTVTYIPMLMTYLSNALPNYYHQSLINELHSYRK